MKLERDYRFSRRVSFNDGKRSRLEDQFGGVLAEIEGREERALLHERREQELDRRYGVAREKTMRAARPQWLEDARASALERQLRDWERAERCREFAKLIQQRWSRNEGGQWADWILEYADRLDLTCGCLPRRMPTKQTSLPI